MGIALQFWQDFKQWDTPSRMAFFIALVLMFPLMAIAINTQDRTQSLAFVGLVGLAIVLQIIVMWGNRHMITTYTRAQRAMMAGDLVTAQQLLEGIVARGHSVSRPISIDVYVLLGNIYRQLGHLSQSETMLTRAIENSPEYHFAVYGFGKTMLAQGNYHEALTRIKKSLSLGAPSVVQFDIGHVAFRLGDFVTAKEALEGVLDTLDEPYRLLMAHHLLNQINATPVSLETFLTDGLPLWEREAGLYMATSYGKDLASDVAHWHKLKKGA